MIIRALLYLLLPVLFLGGALLFYQKVPYPAQHYRDVLGLIPYLLLIAGLVLAFQFNRARLFFIQVLFALVYLMPLVLPQAITGLTILLSVLVFPLVLLLVLLPERGIFTRMALFHYIALLLGGLLVAWLSIGQPTLPMSWIEHSYVPVRYMDWTTLAQTGVLSMFVSFILLLAFYIAWPSMDVAGILGALASFAILFHYQFEGLVIVYVAIAFALMFIFLILQETYRMAYIDELTELPGRRALKEKLQNISGKYSVAMLDIDHFKKFNDTYGHDAGDSVLRMVGGRLRSAEGSKAYRYGGEEFTILFSGKKVPETVALCENIRHSIESADFVIRRQDRRKDKKGAKKARFTNKKVTVTVSIGLAENTAHMANAWDVVKAADKALYRAKRKGRNCTSK
ncbi:MAG: GGDEF domain-containing protein [Gammaproteobacteria bacterium]|nr:GGDEF domain-containing protein [Gammaproteobacteria bacterium]